MPRATTTSGRPVPNAVVASASRKKIKAGETPKVHAEAWQQRAWYYFDVIPEFRYAIGWIGNMCSRGKFVVQKREAGGAMTLVTTGPAYQALLDLFGGPEKHPELLRLTATHLSVSGDGYTVAEDGGGVADDTWDVYSNLRIKPSGNWYRLEGEKSDLKKNAVVIRHWRGHPLDRKVGDSNARASLPILAELDTLTKRVAADSDSRLTGSGILFLPQEITFPSQSITKADGTVEVIQREGVDGFQQMLIENAMIAIGDQESAAAKVPIVAMVPGDSIGKIKHVKFWSEFDAQMQSLREEAVKRLGTGLDMPPEVLSGTADINHWGAWQVDEAAIKVHAEPLLSIIAQAFTESWLWPALKASGMAQSELRLYQFGIDTSELRVRPNRSKEAFELHDRGALSDRALLRENGFTEEDLPSAEEKIAWLTRKVAGGTTSPEVVEAALRALGVKLEVQHAPSESGDPARPTPSLVDHPTREAPNPEESEAEAAKAAAASVMVFRALERAGNRLKNRGIRPDGVPAAELYMHTRLSDEEADQLLVDAFTCPADLAFGCDPEVLQSYARSLMVSRQPLDPKMLGSYLRVRA